MNELNRERIYFGLIGLLTGLILGINLKDYHQNKINSEAYFQLFRYNNANYGVIKFSNKKYTPLIEIENGKYFPLLDYDKNRNTTLDSIIKDLK